MIEQLLEELENLPKKWPLDVNVTLKEISILEQLQRLGCHVTPKNGFEIANQIRERKEILAEISQLERYP